MGIFTKKMIYMKKENHINK